MRLKNSKIFQGEHNPGPPNAHVLFLRKMSMFVGPLTARQINNFFHIYRSRPYNKCCGLSVVAITVFGAENDRNAILDFQIIEISLGGSMPLNPMLSPPVGDLSPCVGEFLAPPLVWGEGLISGSLRYRNIQLKVFLV